MCGLVGISVPTVTAKDIILFEAILRESRIRGLHATGISYLEDGVIYTIKEPVGADRFLEKYTLADCIDYDGSLNLIAHTRYSTSDLRFNQPIANAQLSVVHNGVISQELPSNWPKLYGPIGVCETSNDTELLFNTIQAFGNPIVEWAESSIAALELYWDGTIRAYRNGRRPLYMMRYYEGFIVSSTMDVLVRSGLKPNKSHELKVNTYYATSLSNMCGKVKEEPVYIQKYKDLQHV